ncbi:hypothetical protein HII36_52670 [Nonomuraea sp. NN258]|uniref:hypothetical protein n=1 Tax=Nonomuraea antri TaxID=2730852 RepID=UPI00156A2D9D|nr:hypothetical protein [Nonomuraea antri]NRQ40417.1 hypothetical protein [Nonomuraea antri]
MIEEQAGKPVLRTVERPEYRAFQEVLMQLHSTLGAAALLSLALMAGGVSASAPAVAAAETSAATAKSASAFLLHWSDNHTPTKRWSTHDFTMSRDGRLHFSAFCSGGGNGDRTTITVNLIRTSTGNSWGSATGSCGESVGTSVKVSRGVAYYMRISVTAKRALSAAAWG